MTTHYLKLAEVMERLGVDRELLRMLETEDLIHPKRTLDEEILLSVEDVDRVRVVRILIQELDVNLAGAEVILHMREDMLAMRHQFDEILATLVKELRERLKR
jgi:MerR family transcriptional regulator/heat shock protein HspR